MREDKCSTQLTAQDNLAINRRNILLSSASLLALTATAATTAQAQAPEPAAEPPPRSGKSNILVIFGDDIGQSNISAYTFGLLGYQTPNIDRLGKEA